MKPVVFISWSRKRARHVAHGLWDLIGNCIQLVEPFMSEEDLEGGRRWSPDLAATLERSDFGIIVLTPESQHRPWVMFEAGALSKKMEHSHVVPYLVDMRDSDVTGPLSDFGAYEASEEKAEQSTWKLLCLINKRLGEDALPEARLRKLFDNLWPDMQKVLRSLPDPEDYVPASPREVSDVVREILTTVRQIERQTREGAVASVSDDMVRATMDAEMARQRWVAAQERLSALESMIEDEIDPRLQEEMRARLTRAEQELASARRALTRAQLVRNTVANGAALAPPLRR